MSKLRSASAVGRILRSSRLLRPSRRFGTFGSRRLRRHLRRRRPLCRSHRRRPPPAERAHPARHARRRRPARARQHDPLGQRPAAGMDRPRAKWSAPTSTTCWASPRSSAPISAPSTPRWPPAGPAARRSAVQNRYFRVHAAPVVEQNSPPQHLIVTIRDVTDEVLQQQKLAAIHQAGIELADLTPDEVAKMSVDERIELLKSNILHCTQDVLHFDVVEIRLLDQQTRHAGAAARRGHDARGGQRELRAETTGNGVTGFVAATGKSYLCEDTSEDPLYLEGAQAPAAR